MKNFFWPSFQDIDDAQKSVKTGAYSAFLVAVVTAVVTFLSMKGVKIFAFVDGYAFIDAGLFFVIGFFMTRYSRIAAVAGFCLYAFEQVMMFQVAGPRFSIVPLLFLLYFFHAMRGAFAYHQMRGNAQTLEPQPPRSFPVARTIVIILVLAVAAAGLLAFPRFLSAVRKSQSHVIVSEENPAPSADSPAAAPLPAGAGADVKTFHLKNGSNIRGRIVLNDAVYYTIEKSDGSQEIIIKEDIVSAS